MSILIAILVFGALILIHELGHFITARIFGVGILEFSIGMGPKLVSIRSKKSKTVYSLRLLPLGGYVSMYGEDSEIAETPIPSDATQEERVEPSIAIPNESATAEAVFSPDMAFSHKKVWQRMIICVSGAVMNLLLGFLLMLTITLRQDVYGTTVVHSFKPMQEGQITISESSGLQVGDEILRVNGHRVHISNQLLYRILLDSAEPMEIQVLRHGNEETITLDLSKRESNSQLPLIDFVVVGTKEKSVGTVLKQTYYSTTSQVTLVFESLKGLVTGKYGMEAMSGPVGITSELGNAAKADDQGMTLLSLVVLITVNLGICNLLPLPALDGGRLLFLTIEAIRRKPINPKYEGYIHLIGLGLFFLLFLFITYQDIARLLTK